MRPKGGSKGADGAHRDHPQVFFWGGGGGGGAGGPILQTPSCLEITALEIGSGQAQNLSSCGTDGSHPGTLGTGRLDRVALAAGAVSTTFPRERIKNPGT